MELWGGRREGGKNFKMIFNFNFRGWRISLLVFFWVAKGVFGTNQRGLERDGAHEDQ